MIKMYIWEDDTTTYYCSPPIHSHQYKYSVEISDELYHRYVNAITEFDKVQEILCDIEQTKIRELLAKKQEAVKNKEEFKKKHGLEIH